VVTDLECPAGWTGLLRALSKSNPISALSLTAHESVARWSRHPRGDSLRLSDKAADLPVIDMAVARCRCCGSPARARERTRLGMRELAATRGPHREPVPHHLVDARIPREERVSPGGHRQAADRSKPPSSRYPSRPQMSTVSRYAPSEVAKVSRDRSRTRLRTRSGSRNTAQLRLSSTPNGFYPRE